MPTELTKCGVTNNDINSLFFANFFHILQAKCRALFLHSHEENHNIYILFNQDWDKPLPVNSNQRPLHLPVHNNDACSRKLDISA